VAADVDQLIDVGGPALAIAAMDDDEAELLQLADVVNDGAAAQVQIAGDGAVGLFIYRCSASI
jgi:hypothetical protein